MLGGVVFCCVACSSFPASAGSPYAGLTFGKAYLGDSRVKGTSTDLDYDDGEGYCYAHGLEFGRFRLEGELGYQKNGFATLEQGQPPENGDLSIMSLLGNTYYSFDLEGSSVIPIISAGVGVASVELENETAGYDDGDLVMACQVGAGVGFRLTDKVTLTTMYRYFTTEDPEFSDENEDMKIDISSHNVMMGVKISF
ncbi:MAG TPA: porin family protein [Prosthecochloris aestuarii]|uniref:Porin family protein n=1 Tax=Prosthecochloris aestuarii TaxID=1102 RepID=A0A831WUI2_PROAE|nr:porin family protein [Prosthecochloris aestuarii]